MSRAPRQITLASRAAREGWTKSRYTRELIRKRDARADECVKRGHNFHGGSEFCRRCGILGP